MVWLGAWGALATWIYYYFEISFLAIPWLPVSLIGTAVAFYVGFKNNSAYDRLWEARKIWGAIVNDSRSFAVMSKAYISDFFQKDKTRQEDILLIKKELIYRHIAWLYQLREQLLVSTPWEHVNAKKHVSRINKKRRESWGVGALNFDNVHELLEKYLKREDLASMEGKSNKATQIIDKQAQSLKQARESGIIDDFRHMEMQNVLNRFYDHQGKCERIKNYPLPRQYASVSLYFVGLFIFLLPFSMLGQFEELGVGLIWLNIPFTIIVGWVFIMMELVGDYSENPFEGLGNDIPMLSLTRTIERDLLELLDEKEIPDKIEAINHTLL